MFLTPASGSSATTHEVLATAITAVLKQTADFNTINKLLKVCLVFLSSRAAAVTTLTSREHHFAWKSRACLFTTTTVWLRKKRVAACSDCLIPRWGFSFSSAPLVVTPVGIFSGRLRGRTYWIQTSCNFALFMCLPAVLLVLLWNHGKVHGPVSPGGKPHQGWFSVAQTKKKNKGPLSGLNFSFCEAQNTSRHLNRSQSEGLQWVIHMELIGLHTDCTVWNVYYLLWCYLWKNLGYNFRFPAIVASLCDSSCPKTSACLKLSIKYQ